jgi:Holliday junction resolvase
MAQTPEKKVKDSVTKILKAHGAYYFYPVMGGYGRSGIPDIIVCHKGKFIAIECKAGSNTATALQEAELKKIEDAGGIAVVVNENNLDTVTHLIDAINDVNDLKEYR